MALLTCYLDDSGTHLESAHVAVGGLVARQDDWDAFSPRWNEAIAGMGLTHWHSTDAENLRGEYGGWTRERREEAIRRLLPIVADVPGVVGAGAYVQRNMWERYMPARGREVFGDEYVLANHIIFSFLGERLVAQGIDSDAWIAYILDRRKGNGAVIDLFNEAVVLPGVREKYRLYNAASGDWMLAPLQAADMVAYELYKEETRWQEQRPERRWLHNELNKLFPKRYDRANPSFLLTLDGNPLRALYEV
ncbi:MAG: hypothetical protein C4558_09380 [Dehalococcoidia bacterium]|nr:MAG: hypothetical protein C4558_09380 [Dehalococcoidia bacterium]